MNDNDKKALNEVLDNLTEDDVCEDDGYEADNGSKALVHVRKMFSGTPFEKTLTDAIIICDAMASKCRDLS